MTELDDSDAVMTVQVSWQYSFMTALDDSDAVMTVLVSAQSPYP
jgi:hypothetical protein